MDGILQQGRRALRADGQARLDVYPLSQMLDLKDLAGAELVAAAGCRIERRLIGPISLGPQVFPVPQRPVVDALPLPQFLKSPCLVAKGAALTRSQVVKYVANKLGGVHFDTSRNRKADNVPDLTSPDETGPQLQSRDRPIDSAESADPGSTPDTHA